MDIIDSCVLNCPLGKYIDISNHCDLCNQICQTCFGPTEFNCLICNYGYNIYNYNCYETCPAATYNSTISNINVCLDCPYGCLVCTNSSICSICSALFLSNNGTCIQ
jgi:proprotein convertase subtilisin/kexin type 5